MLALNQQRTGVEERDLANRNVQQADLDRSQKRKNRRSTGLVGVRIKAQDCPEFKFTSLLHHVNEELRTRFAKFGLKLHDKKTRLIEFGRRAARNRQARGEKRPETFDFLGFTHRCDVTRQGWFALRRESIAKRMRAKLAQIKIELRKRRHQPIGVTGHRLKQVVQGWCGYHAVPGNLERLKQFCDETKKMWLHPLRRRSQRHRWTWDRFIEMFERFVPQPKILHPYPSDRFRARLKAGAV